jgi:hypothetical protein
VLAVTGLRSLPDQARALHSAIEVGHRDSRLDREQQPARTVGLTDPRLFLVAERVVPLDATFLVTTGPRADIKDPLVLRWVRRFARYRLLPRRLVRYPQEAEWILSYGGRVPAGVRVKQVFPVSPGVRIIEAAPS